MGAMIPLYGWHANCSMTGTQPHGSTSRLSRALALQVVDASVYVEEGGGLMQQYCFPLLQHQLALKG